MTALASNILVALPGVGVRQDAGGATTGQAAGASTGGGASFEGMLETLMGGADLIAGTGTGTQTGSSATRLAAEPDETGGQGAAETLLAGLLALPFVAPPQPTQVATPQGETQPLAASAANVAAAAVDAALPAPAEAAVDAVASVLGDALSKDAVAATPEVPLASTATVTVASDPAAPPVAARAALASLSDDGTRAETATPTGAESRTAAPTPTVAAPDVQTAAASAPDPVSREPAASSTAAQVALPEAVRAVVQAAGAAVSAKTTKVEASASSAVAAPAREVAVEDEAVVVTASAIADAAGETAEAPPVAAQAAVASAAAPVASKPVAPVESRRATRLAEAGSTSGSGDASAAHVEKTAAKAEAATLSPVKVIADETSDAPLAPVDIADAAPASASEGQVAEPGVSSAATHHAEAAPIVRGSPETVARLAADIAQKLSSQNTKFDIQLDPLGLGKVDVSVEINADGRLTAALSFDSAAAAADLKGRSAELRQALQQAGFEVSDNGLSFDMAGQNPGFGGGRQADEQPGGRSSRAFQSVQSGLDDADARLTAALSNRSRTPSGGVDIRI